MKDLFEELKKENPQFQNNFGMLKFVYYIHDPLLWIALINSIKTVDIDKHYKLNLTK